MGMALGKFVSDSFYGGALTTATLCKRNGELTVDRILGKVGGSPFGIWIISFHRKVVTSKQEKSQLGKWHLPEDADINYQSVIGLLAKNWSVRSLARPLREVDFLVVAAYSAQFRAVSGETFK